MTLTRKQLITRDRLRLQNPYAHAEELAALNNQEAASETVRAADTSFQQARERSPSPHSCDVPLFQNHFASSAGCYSKKRITKIVRDLQGHLWKNRKAIWPEREISDPMDVLDLEIALKAVGYEYREVIGLEDQVGKEGDRVRVAGLINPIRREVVISGQFQSNVRAFTAAHELGHAILHPNAGAVHRDLPVDGTKVSADPMEREADTFATYFLMPEKLVVERYSEAFGHPPFALTEETAFALGKDLSGLEQACPSIDQLCFLLADTQSYNGRHFVSLAEQFRVSKTAMAIRLKELGLVR